MKTFLSGLAALMFISFSGIALADVVTVGVPITVEKDTYVVTTPDYYYYSGHRCYVEKRTDLGEMLGLRPSFPGGKEIYCYSYTE